MGISIEDSVRANFILRWMMVWKMRDALSELEDDDLLYPNQVGNMTVVRGGQAIGYIDFHEESFERFGEE